MKYAVAGFVMTVLKLKGKMNYFRSRVTGSYPKERVLARLATSQNQMGLINTFKPLSTFLKPAPLINLSSINNFSSEFVLECWV